MIIKDFLLTYGQLFSVTLIPVIVWFLGIKFQNRMLKRKSKEDLFLKLIANRKKNPPSIKWADSLNQIDVVFQDEQKVRAAWRAYYDSLHPNSQHFSNQNSFLLDLLSEIAISLGYKNLKQTEIDRFYQPKYFGDTDAKKQELLDEQLRVFKTSAIFRETFQNQDEEEVIEILNEVDDEVDDQLPNEI